MERKLQRGWTVKEVLEWIAQPNTLEERGENYKIAIRDIHYLRKAIYEAYNPSFTFKEILEVVKKEVSEMRHYDTLRFDFFWKEYQRYADSNKSMSPYKKANQITDLFRYMNKDDVIFAIGLMEGKLIAPQKINPLFLKYVDPELFVKK